MKGEVELLKHDAHRFPWAKTIVILFVMTSLGLLLGHSMWTSRERSAVERRVAAIRAAGEPMDAADFATKPVPTTQDVVPLIRTALAALVRDGDRDARVAQIETDDAWATVPPISDEWLVLMRADLAANAATLAAIADANQRPLADWKQPPLSPPSGAAMNELGQLRTLANLLGAQSLVAHHDGHGDLAIEALFDIDALAAGTSQRFGVVNSLVGLGMHALAADRAINVAPDLALDESARARARELIAHFLDDAPPTAALRSGLLAERYAIYDSAERTLAGTNAAVSINGVARYAMRPPLIHAEGLAIDQLTELLRVLRVSRDLATFDTNSATLNGLTTVANSGRLAALYGTMIVGSNPRRMAASGYQVITNRHLAAAALAVRFYALDHDGQRPSTLDALVPAYLATVPIDAMDGKPLRYDAARSIVWSVGINGSDDGGDETLARPQDAGDRWRMKDVVVHLTHVTKPATQPTTGVAGN